METAKKFKTQKIDDLCDFVLVLLGVNTRCGGVMGKYAAGELKPPTTGE